MPMMALHVASSAGTPAAKRFMPRIVSAIALVESPEATPAMWLSMGAKARERMLRALVCWIEPDFVAADAPRRLNARARLLAQGGVTRQRFARRQSRHLLRLPSLLLPLPLTCLHASADEPRVCAGGRALLGQRRAT